MKSSIDSTLSTSAEITCTRVLDLKPGERVLIVTNPEDEVLAVSQALYAAARETGAVPVLIIQPVRTQLDFADAAVLAALHTGPDVVLSISAEKIGKDPRGLKQPYRYGDREFDHIFDYLLSGAKSMRAVWSPGITSDIFRRTVNIDYGRLKTECDGLIGLFNRAAGMRVSCAAGTDLFIGLTGRFGEPDNGDFSRPGSGGNLPAGEAFASPELGTVSGTIVFRGSISLNQGDILIHEPIVTSVEKGFVTDVKGGPEAAALRDTIAAGESRAEDMAASGALPDGTGAVYRRNARGIGEIGIGLNPSAAIVGNMLEDEKAYKTCHIAVGANYADDAPALIHCDGLVLNPTITFLFPGGDERMAMKDGELRL